jgi:hypothetical protein
MAVRCGALECAIMEAGQFEIRSALASWREDGVRW